MKQKRWLSLVLAAILVLAFTACNPAAPGGEGDLEPAETGDRFDDYLRTLPAEFLEPDSLDLNFLFQDPASAGIQRELAVLPFATEEEAEEDYEEIRGILKTLDEFSREELREDQRITLEILTDYLGRMLRMEDYFYLDESYLGSYIGYQAQLPMLLNEYQLFQKEDLDSYFNVLSTAKDTFLQYAGREQERQDHGVGMPQVILDGVIEQCDNFVEGGVQFMVDSMDKKIDAAEFLSEDEKTQAKEKNRALLEGDFVEAYRSLGDALREIHGREDDNGLWSVPGGKGYYEALLQKQNGINMSVEEVKSYLTQRRDELLADLREEASQDPLAYLRFANGGVKYSDYTSVESILNFLSRRMLEDFPYIGELHFEVNQVPDSMKDNFSPAAYLQSRIDTPLEQNEAIYINGEFTPDLFLTAAHEGYPGHMYQNVYFKSLQLPVVRYLVGYGGWTEGWANYVELTAYRYCDDAPATLRFAAGEERLKQYEMALMDIGIHYDGWTFEDAWAHMNETYGFEFPEEVAYRQYKIFLEDPGNYQRYYLTGSFFWDLYRDARRELGEDFNPVLFHKAILDLGPAPISMVKQAVYGYVADVQREKAQALLESASSKAA